MILPLDRLCEYDFALSSIRVILQKTPYRQLQIKSRKLNGFVYLLRGQCRFTCDTGGFTMEPGAIAYLPYGSQHIFDILTDDTEFYRIDFHLTVQNEVVLFSEMPLRMCHAAPAECTEAIRRLAGDYEFVQDSVAKTELMCRIFRGLSGASVAYEKKRLAPAISYLSGHLTEKISCKSLARLCSLSTAQFYNIFKSEYAVTPLEYRNRLLLQRACMLLKDGSLSITEIAELLGFESMAYFSRFFKKHTGVSPTQYLRSEISAK